MTLRARLTIFYAGSVGILLIVVFAGLLWLQPRIGLALIDADLRSHAHTIDGVLQYELSEGHDIQGAASELVIEVQLPGVGVAIHTPQGKLLDARWEGLEPLQDAFLPAQATSISRTISTAGGPARVLQTRVGANREWAVVLVSSMAPVARQTSILRRTLLVVVPITVLAAALGGWFVLTRAFRPVEIMARDVEQITAADLGKRLGVGNAPAELAGLARRFNELLDRLSTALERQREFMADASHELRTPAHVARTAAEVTLSTDVRTPADYREALSVVADQTRRMSRLIDDMLLLARADMGRRPVEPAFFYLDDLAADVVRGLRLLAAPRQVTLALESTPDLQVQADEALVRQLLTNLIENAIRHSPSPGTVTVRVGRHAAEAIIDVIDEGPGVPASERERIFERFVKSDPARIHSKGAGLGLPIARWICEAHGGTLALAETSPDGSTFRATLPLVMGSTAPSDSPA